MQDRQIVLIGATVAILLIVLGISYLISLATQAGKTAVDIIVYPRDSTVTVNDKPGGAGVTYLEPGEYTFKASKTGWSEVSQTVTIGTEQTSVTLLPKPETAEAERWLDSNDPDVYAREGVAGRIANEEGNKLHDDNPVIAKLPYQTPKFEITYNETTNSPSGIEILIIATGPPERNEAVQQLRSWGFDPSTMQINYIGYNNPLQGAAQ